LPESEIMGLSDGEEIIKSFCFDTVPAVKDGRTDRHVTVAKTRSMHSIAQ